MDAERLLATSEVAMEYAALKNDDHCPKGMYIIPSVDSILSWDGVIFVHKGYYADSILKFRIRFPFTYPNRPPNVTFVTDVFHPLISNDDGTLNISPRFSPWRPKQDHKMIAPIRKPSDCKDYIYERGASSKFIIDSSNIV
ncbi:UBC [Pyrrhoderma noxium]|uniref:UBC n=1 Tax=Pyrrhoderma noxium TaxID=2282107 RepID=A0A286UTH4_9AGAM|nr:UBC [Pyrrhoderma noxium]